MNLSTPSSSSTTNTSSRSMPTALSWSNTACASSPLPDTTSPLTSPWSAKAFMVFSGIVFTVSATTRSVT